MPQPAPVGTGVTSATSNHQPHAAICRIRCRRQRPPALLHGMASLGWACQRDGGHAQCAADGVPWASLSRSARAGNRCVAPTRNTWRGPERDQSVNVMTSVDGLVYSSRVTLPSRSQFGPAIAIYRRQPVVAWIDAVTRALVMVNGLNGAPVATGQTGAAAPALASCGRGAGRRMDGNECRETAQRDVVCERFSAVGQGDSSPGWPERGNQHFRTQPGL